MMSANKNIVIIGAGAAGYFAAINTKLNYPEAQVTILEKSNKTLQKVKISGGGRCNVTHYCLDNALLSRNYPRGQKELQQAFHVFSVKDTIAWFKQQGVQLVKEHDNRMFPLSNNSQSIIDCFEQNIKKLGIKLWLNAEVQTIEKNSSHFDIQIKGKEKYYADYVIVTTGGYFQKEAYSFLSCLRINIVNPVPSLFTFNVANKEVCQLMGVSVAEVEVKISGTNYSHYGPILITHWGFSGPAVLVLSSKAAEFLYDCKYDFDIIINWTGKHHTDSLFQQLLQIKNKSNITIRSIYKEIQLPSRLIDFLLTKSGIDPHKKMAEISNKLLNSFCRIICENNYNIKGKTTFKEEFVTCGGVDLKEVNFKTMESKKIKGIYFAGEVLNIDGVTGGFNFQAAWTTAYIAAQLKEV